MTAILDAHTHIWQLEVTPQPWISAEAAPAIARDFSLGDLQTVAQAAGVGGAILVQSANDAPETARLLQQAAADPFVAGVVGWAELAAPAGPDMVEAARAGAGGAHLCGYRHVFEPGAAPGWLRAPVVAASLEALAELGLAFDLLLQADELPLATEVAHRHPGTTFVLDHLAKPDVKAGAIEPWRRDLRVLADAGNVYAKISGLPAEADWGSWSAADLRPYFDAALEAFGADRLIFATDWPVCTVAGSYSTVIEAQLQLCADLTAEERDRLLSLNAMKAYGRLRPSCEGPPRDAGR